ncbi:hypothetical protein Lfu02_34450 [Longispora fulva]|uniref:NUDIX hydrolase n=1 Tax=Longispora fulva TaxID=619741 RepID=A0A8J7KPW8_9ACTN|nr:hypothetical protein [Longispora fulva]MBG6141771.1 hypothetical protein [Longispora fulva]GIG59073.1 hypothetical protein Lfu02_34450 [Longispora fulva]
MWWVVVVVLAVVLVASYVTWLAARVERLHDRAAAAAAALDAHLVRRAVAATSLANGGLPELRDAARTALAAGPEDRSGAENDLTRQLRALEWDPDAMADVVTTSRRVALARQVHDDLVRDALAARRRNIVRMLRLARKYPKPTYFDIEEPTLGT